MTSSSLVARVKPQYSRLQLPSGLERYLIIATVADRLWLALDSMKECQLNRPAYLLETASIAVRARVNGSLDMDLNRTTSCVITVIVNGPSWWSPFIWPTCSSFDLTHGKGSPRGFTYMPFNWFPHAKLGYIFNSNVLSKQSIHRNSRTRIRQHNHRHN